MPVSTWIVTWWAAGRRAMLRARARQRIRQRNRHPVGRALTAVILLVAGLMMAVSAVNARGTEFRPGATDLADLVRSEAQRNAGLARQVTALRAEVDTLSGRTDDSAATAAAVAAAGQVAGTVPVSGPAVTVTLEDAPASVAANGIDPDLLVVHQQDIQAVVNQLWAAGAEAMTIQGQRVIATTGIKCVGNVVVLHGIPYAPPYVISAIGDTDALQRGLENSEFVQIYQQYVRAYGLGYAVKTQAKAEFPAYQGSLELRYARSADGAPPSGDEGEIPGSTGPN